MERRTGTKKRREEKKPPAKEGSTKGTPDRNFPSIGRREEKSQRKGGGKKGKQFFWGEV